MAALNLRTRLDSIPTPEESFAEMFGDSGETVLVKPLKISDLAPYPDQPFRPYSPDKLKLLAEDIRQNGILSPVIVRPMPPDMERRYDYYQILSGHNRVAAAQLLRMETVPAIIKEVDDDLARLILVNTNLNQRDELLPSEKAFAYRMQMDAMKHQGQRTDLTSGPLVEKLMVKNGAEHEDINFSSNGAKVHTVASIAETSNESAAQIKRYVRLTYLVKDLLDKVDTGNLPFRAGVDLSYLSEDEQMEVDAYLLETRRKISLEQAAALKRYSAELGPITRNDIETLFQEGKTERQPAIKFTQKNLFQLRQFLPKGAKNQEAIDYILEALKYYNLAQQMDRKVPLELPGFEP